MRRLSQLQRRILAWLVADAPRPRGPMAASHQALVQALLWTALTHRQSATS